MVKFAKWDVMCTGARFDAPPIMKQTLTAKRTLCRSENRASSGGALYFHSAFLPTLPTVVLSKACCPAWLTL